MTPTPRPLDALRAALDCAADFETRASPELLATARAALASVEALLRESREVIEAGHDSKGYKTRKGCQTCDLLKKLAEQVPG